MDRITRAAPGSFPGAFPMLPGICPAWTLNAAQAAAQRPRNKETAPPGGPSFYAVFLWGLWWPSERFFFLGMLVYSPGIFRRSGAVLGLQNRPIGLFAAPAAGIRSWHIMENPRIDTILSIKVSFFGRLTLPKLEKNPLWLL